MRFYSSMIVGITLVPPPINSPGVKELSAEFVNINELSDLVGKRILITGGAGFIGSALANKLAVKNQVFAIDNLSSGNWSRCSELVQKVEIDLFTESFEKLSEHFVDIDYVFHLAAVKLNSPKVSPSEIFLINVETSRKVFQAAMKNKVKKVLFTSSLYAYGNNGPEIMEENQLPVARSHYGISKLTGENLLEVEAKNSGVPFVIARLFFVYGPRQFSEGGYKSVIMKNFELKGRRLPAEIYGSGNQALDYVFIDDCINALIELMVISFQGTVNISTGIATTISSVINNINSLFDDESKVFLPADWTDGTVRVGSPVKLNEILGWQPSTSLDRGLKVIWEWWNDKNK